MEKRAVFHLGNCEVKQFIPTTCSSVLEEIMKKRTYPCGAFFFIFTLYFFNISCYNIFTEYIKEVRYEIKKRVAVD